MNGTLVPMLRSMAQAREWASIRLWRELISNSGDAEALYWLGRAYKARPLPASDYLLAARYSQQAADMAGVHTELGAKALLNTVTPHLRRGAISRAKAALGVYFTALPQMDAGGQALLPHVYYKLGQIGMDTLRWGEATSAFRMCLDHSDSERYSRVRQQAILCLADCAVAQGQVQEAGEWLDLRRWTQLPNGMVWPLYLASKARQLHAMQDYAKAARCAHMAISGLQGGDEWNTDVLEIGDMYAILLKIAVATGDQDARRKYAECLYDTAGLMPKAEWLNLLTQVDSQGGAKFGQVAGGISTADCRAGG